MSETNNRECLLAIAEFLGDQMTVLQASRLMDEARGLSVDDRAWLLRNVPGTPFYTELSQHDAETGGMQ